MFQLKILGSADLRAADGKVLLSVLAQPKRLALLAYLTVNATGEFVGRTKLIELLWPTSEPEDSRASLRKALSFLRKSFGPGVLDTRGTEDVGIFSGSLECDVVRFEAALDADELKSALELYRGPLLDGVVAAEAPGLNRWIEDQRSRLARRAAQAAALLADRAEEGGELEHAAGWAQRALDIEPYSDVAVRRLIAILGRGGHREAAVETYDAFVGRLAGDLDAEPEPETLALTESIRDRPSLPVPKPEGPAEGSRPMAAVDSSGPGAPIHTLRPRRIRRLIAIGTVTLAAFIIGGVLWGSFQQEQPNEVLRYRLVMAEGEEMWDVPGRRLAVSPDGTRFVYAGGPGKALRVRDRDDLRATELPGTEGGRSPFFSPDGERVGFMASDQIKVVSLQGGPIDVVADDMDPWGRPAWGPNGMIYASRPGFGGLVRIPADASAQPEPFTAVDPTGGESQHKFPDVLPNGAGLVFTVDHGDLARSTWSIAAADLETGTHRILTEGLYAQYAVSGHLLFVTPDSTLMVAPFDSQTLEIKGPPRVVSRGIRVGFRQSADLAVSSNGTLVYATGSATPPKELVWVSRDGTAEALDPPWQGDLAFPRLSPDGSRVAVSLAGDVWIRRLDTGASHKLTVDEDVSGYPSWTPDGRSVTYFSNATEPVALWTKSADGGGRPVLAASGTRDLAESLWSHDGEWLIYRTSNVPQLPAGGGDQTRPGASDLFAIRPEPGAEPVPIANTEFAELAPSLSPDGRWLAYASNPNGHEEVFVVPFPNAGEAKWSVAPEGGTEPLWSPRTGELIYRDLQNNVVAVEAETTPTFSIGRTNVVFSSEDYVLSGLHHSYDVSPDGQRFLMVRPIGNPDPGEIIVVENWFRELDALLGREQ